jgi:hypothetical protein
MIRKLIQQWKNKNKIQIRQKLIRLKKTNDRAFISVFLINEEDLLEQLIRIKVNSSLRDTSQNVRNDSFVKTSDSLQFPCFCQNFNQVIVFHVIWMSYYVLVLLDSRAYRGKGIHKEHCAHFGNPTAYEILFHESAMWNPKFFVNFFASFKNKHLHSPTERNHQIHTQSFVKASHSMLFLYLLHCVHNTSGLLKIFLGV